LRPQPTTKPSAQREHQPTSKQQAALPSQASTANYPAVDFKLTPENIRGNTHLSRVPTLDLIVKNRGSFAIKNVRLRATEYQLDMRYVVPPVSEKLPGDKIRVNPGKTELFIKSFTRQGRELVISGSIAARSKSKSLELSTIWV
jgi:hypothetical protein